MTTHLICARLATEVYTRGGGRPPQGWRLSDSHYPERRWNLGMAVYVNDVSKEMVVAFRGTEKIWDFIADMGLWQQQVHPNQEHVENRVFSALADDASHRVGNIDRQTMTRMDSIIPCLSKTIMSDSVALALLRQVMFLSVFSAVSSGAMGGLTSPVFLSIVSASIGVAAIGIDVIQARLKENVYAELRNAERKNPTLVADMKRVVEQEKIQKLTFVGHSMGGYLAEMSACRFSGRLGFPVEAVVFDSPGSRDVTMHIEQYRHADYSFLTAYLAAPNMVNTCHSHAGHVRRLFIPHVEGSLSWRHAGVSLLHSGFRAFGYGLGLAAAVASGGSMLGASAVVVEKAAAISAAAWGILSPVAISRGAAGVWGTYGDTVWLLRQHSMTNILDCFNPRTGMPAFWDEMQQWPYLGTAIRARAGKIATETLNSLRPLPSDFPGVRVIFNENGMRERQVTSSGEYQIRRKHRRVGDVTWAD